MWRLPLQLGWWFTGHRCLNVSLPAGGSFSLVGEWMRWSHYPMKVAEPEACDEMYESLARLHSNYYKHKYPRPRDTSFSGLTLEEYKLILATDTLGELKDMNKGLWKKLQEKFSTRSPEKQKAWAQSLSRPRT
ncbi:ubiquinol-cytochrome-c reductase complex assembly factor 2 isoform X2 [Myotis lucifugus]|uniref:ubiquinol-cytochrome-c reductase complex assembly factor 2 isoform X2 n=1 Tax=Myotis lucifugus TaxID=59463 RepID=UPI000CCC520B|nr:ubiquinol-cytochrome-c reductase complex assembly factor 2 isoform X2 [Myotis lucifugus]